MPELSISDRRTESSGSFSSARTRSISRCVLSFIDALVWSTDTVLDFSAPLAPLAVSLSLSNRLTIWLSGASSLPGVNVVSPVVRSVFLTKAPTCSNRC
jgi:hypothetical protein